MPEKILIAADHGGYKLKSEIQKALRAEFEFHDLGTDKDASVDYPDFASAVAEKISSGEHTRGILICGTGIGMCMAANKFRRVRAALATSEDMARLSIEHNNANILCLGERILDQDTAIAIVKTWLNTTFDTSSKSERHMRRIDKICKLEE